MGTGRRRPDPCPAPASKMARPGQSVTRGSGVGLSGRSEEPGFQVLGGKTWNLNFYIVQHMNSGPFEVGLGAWFPQEGL